MTTAVDMYDVSDTLLYSTGKGNWKGFQVPLSSIVKAAESWKKLCANHSKLWLCWNVDPDWCLVQQKLARECGYTPLVGGDSRARPPKLIDGAIYIDFNKHLNLPMFHMVLAIEFAFLYVPDKLAFWHSDLLVRREKLHRIADKMDLMSDKEMLVTLPGRGMKQRLLGQQRRYWELIGCTNRKISEHQFKRGAGWMANIMYHPMSPQDQVEKRRRAKQYYDHGAGVLYWAEHYKPKDCQIHVIKEALLDEGHFSRIRAKNYRSVSPNNAKRDLTSELSLNFNLKDEAAKLGLSDLIAPEDVSTDNVISMTRASGR
ncbi:MAG: hypothetical protein CBC55_00885 [Gammaproteobacteria bacterium TMED95]|nr:MAG: hypothetical protein CBC55_00885 [Gammaproteobacteria bacterium TMED95]|tara:strand:+ start:7479 stop:8423 length:945 start_codon:yes stop_codon:yes gene_type:complete